MSALNKLPIEVKRKEDGGSFLIEGSSWSRYGNYFFPLCYSGIGEKLEMAERDSKQT